MLLIGAGRNVVDYNFATEAWTVKNKRPCSGDHAGAETVMVRHNGALERRFVSIGGMFVYSSMHCPFNTISSHCEQPNTYIQHNHGYGSYYCDYNREKCHIDETTLTKP